MDSVEEVAGFRLRDRVLFGLRAGARLGAYLAALTAVVAVVSGRVRGDTVSAIPAAALVFSGAVVGVVVLAIGRSSVRHSWGAALLGAACLAPTTYGVAIAGRSLSNLDWGLVLAIGAFTLILGAILGVMSWRGWTRRF
jgi:hypothetical protein